MICIKGISCCPANIKNMFPNYLQYISLKEKASGIIVSVGNSLVEWEEDKLERNCSGKLCIFWTTLALI